MATKDDYFYKINRTNGTEYLQIWKRVNGAGKDRAEFVRSCGPAYKLYGSLVRLDQLEIQTKKMEESLTKLAEVKGVSLDQIQNGGRKDGS